MAFRRAAALLGAALVVLILVRMFPPPAGAAQSSGLETIDVTASPIRTFKIGSEEMRFGPLTFVGGLEMTSDAGAFGSLSAFRFLKPGSDFIGVADTGFWAFGHIDHDEDGRPSGVSGVTMQPMVDEEGRAIGSKWLSDAEGLAVRGDIATVGFERDHRVSEFRIDPAGMKAPIRDLDFLVPRKELRMNKGFETVTYALQDGPLKGARVIVAEKSLDENGNRFAAILEGPEKGVFTVKRSGKFDVTDGAFLPNGDLLLLERSFSYADGVAMQLRRIDGRTIGPGKLADGPVLLQADMSYQIDNMEGLDVWRRGDGALMVSIVSDDNQSLLERHLYLEFRLNE
jgi:hypothetical protein